MRIVSLVACLLLCSGAAASAVEPVPGIYRYRIHHQIFGDIGEHQIQVTREGDNVVVEHAAHLAVKLLTFTAFERQSHYREVWQGLRLMAFDGLTIDNGERFEVRARADGDNLSIEGSAGRFEAPATTVPSQPSLAGAIARTTFMDIRTGRLLAGRVTLAGHETLQLASGPVETERYEVAGDLEHVVWYDATGVVAQWRLWRQGAAITLTRESSSPPP
jgi:Domain of unknown function (DUF6134)